MYKKLIAKKEEIRAALNEQTEQCESVEAMKDITRQIIANNKELAELRAMQDEYEAKEAAKTAPEQITDERTAAVSGDKVEERKETSPAFIPGKGFQAAEESRADEHKKDFEERDKAGAELRADKAVESALGVFGEIRSVTIGDGSTIAVPDYTARVINPDFPVVSSLVDGVAHMSLNGGDSFKQPYVLGIAAGDYKAEGIAAADAETAFGYANIARTKITAYGEISEEILKLPNAPYADEVFKNIRTSMRMKLSKEILLGDGEDGHLTGIFSSKATAIETAADLELAAIDDTTLDEIVYNYGGQEDVEGAAVLILNKLDLLAFAKVRTSTQQKFYDIRTNGNTGTINGIPFVINSACAAISASTTNAGAYSMAYGNLSNYLIVEFSPIEVKRSEHAKFKEGMISYRGNAITGGNVVRHNGFLRVKKANKA